MLILSFAHTNSPIESYNNKIKSSFTMRIKHNMIPAVEILENLVTYESTKEINFKNLGVVNNSMMKRAHNIINNNLINKNGEKLYYARSDGSTRYVTSGVCVYV